MKFFQKNKILIFIIMTIFLVLVYTSLNTFLSNDDLPYMYFYRGVNRITNILEVIKNQIADYKYINGRFIVHCIVQTLLIFDKKLWVILNPMVIITLIYILTLIIKDINKENKINYKCYLLMSIMFLLMINYKYIIYWVAGSVNYVWVALAIFAFIYYYYKKKIDDHILINIFIILFVSILHEMSLVFMIIFLLTNYILKLILKEKINKKELLYIIPIIISIVVIFSSKGNQNRLIDNEMWNQLSLIQKIGISLPTISKNLLNIRNIYNIIPSIYILSIIYKLINLKKNKIYPLIVILISIFSITINSGYIYILLSSILLILEIYIHITEKNIKLIPLTLAFYGIVYANIIVPNYMDGRPNFFLYIYMIMIITIFIKNIIEKEYIKYVLIIIFVLVISKEIYVYTIIGNIQKDRVKIIDNCVKNSCEVLELPKIPSKYTYYHVDPNSPDNKEYYTYRYYVQYYNLPNNIEIKYQEWRQK